jgi:hypothetical protein
VHAATVIAGDGCGRGGAVQRREPTVQVGEHGGGEARADATGMDELPGVVGDGEHQ